MVDRKEVQAGDDAAGVNDAQPAADQQDTTMFGLSAEETQQFLDMQRNSGPDAQIDQGGEGAADPNAGETSRDAQADADAAAAAAALTAKGAGSDQEQPQGQQDGGAEDDEDEPDPTQGGKFPQRVNYHRFKRQQERARSLSEELAKEREKNARIDERFKVLAEALQAPDPKARQDQQGGDDLGEMPDPEKDIFKAFEWSVRKLGQLETQLHETRNGVQQDHNEATLRTSYAQDIQTFASKTPDFPKAYEHMMATRVAELANQMFDIDLYEEGAQLLPQQLQQISGIVENEERQLATTALKSGRSPSAQLYRMAKARGYRPTAAAPAAAVNGQAQQNGNGTAVPAGKGTPAAKPASTVSAAVAAAKKGVETNRTLSTGGGAPEGQLTAQQVIDMDEDAFNVLMQTASKEQLRAILGN